MALRTAIPVMNMLQELQDYGFNVSTSSKIHCKVFEDNNGALEIARVPKMRPRTKHINCKYYHFMEYTDKPDANITLHRIDSEENPADTLTKPNEVSKLKKHQKFIWGW
jgi:hypothetical protein